LYVSIFFGLSDDRDKKVGSSIKIEFNKPGLLLSPFNESPVES